jgi:hypothetical protein
VRSPPAPMSPSRAKCQSADPPAWAPSVERPSKMCARSERVLFVRCGGDFDMTEGRIDNLGAFFLAFALLYCGVKNAGTARRHANYAGPGRYHHLLTLSWRRWATRRYVTTTRRASRSDSRLPVEFA